MDRLLPFLMAMIVTVTLVAPLSRLAGQLGLLDAPGGRKVHAMPIPRIGGIAMFLGFVPAVLIWLPLDRELETYLVAATVLVVFGVWDDRATLGATPKFIGQLLAIGIVVFGGELGIHTLTFVEPAAVAPWIGQPLTVLFLLGITNAINLSDGLDGLAAGTTFLCCSLIAMLALTGDNGFVLTLSVVLMGSTLGFLRYNSWPARIFMGDAGSQFLGFSVGVLSLALTQASGTALSAALPLLLLGLPIIDTLTVMTLRLREGRSPFVADRKHLHHKLLALGFDHYEAVVVIYLVQALLILTAWQLRFDSDLLIIAAFAFYSIAGAGGMLMAERSGWRWRHSADPAMPGRRASAPSLLLRLYCWLGDARRLPRWSLLAAGLCAGSFLLLIVTTASNIPGDVAVLAAGLALLLGASAPLQSAKGPLASLAVGAIQMSLYVGAVLTVYLDYLSPSQAPWIHACKWLLLPCLALATLLHLRFGNERRFDVTPLDVLLLIAAFVLPNLPGLSTVSNLSLSVVKLVVLLYAVELLFRGSTRLRLGSSVLATVCLAVVAARGLLGT